MGGHGTRHLAGGIVLLAFAFNSSPATAGTLAPSPTMINFGNVLVGASATQNVVITNSGSTTTIGDDTIIGSTSTFITNDGCSGLVLAPGESCVIQVTFGPTARGVRTATLNIPSDANTATVSLTGTGVAPVVGVSPGSLAFGSGHVGTQSATQVVTVTNSTNDGQTATISSVTLSGGNALEFAITADSCTLSNVPANGGSCQVSVAFAPASPGAKAATLTVTSNDPVNPTRTVSLSGTGTSPIVSVSDGPLGFGLQHVGTRSASMVVTVANDPAANEAATVSAALSGTDAAAFAITANSCNVAIAPGASCQVSLALAPTSSGAKSASLDVSTNDAANPSDSVGLTGIGTSPIVSVSDGPLSFGAREVATQSAPTVVTVANDAAANEAATISAALSGTDAADFAITSNGCASPVAPGQTCDVMVAFAPGSTGDKSASLDLTTNDPGNPNDSIALSGTATAAVSTADADPPETTITRAPSRKTRKRRATVEFTASEDVSTFECSLDGRASTACTSPLSLRVKRGRHTLTVFATDPAGNRDPSPAVARWKVKRARGN